MPRYTVPIFLIAVVLCCSTLAYPATESKEFTPTDEGKLHRVENKVIKNHEGAFGKDGTAFEQNEKNKTLSSRNQEREPETDKNEESFSDLYVERMLAILDIIDFSNSLSGSEEERLVDKLVNAATDRHWDSTDDFVKYCVKMRMEAEGFDFQETDLPKNSIHSVMYSC